VNGHRTPMFFIGVDNRANLLSEQLGDEQPVYKLDILAFEKERGVHEPLEITDIANRFILEMKSVQPSGPYIVGGFCRNSLLGYEICQQLIAEGDEIAFLAVFDYWQHRDSTSWLQRQLENLKDFGWRYIFRKIRLKWVRLREKIREKLNINRINNSSTDLVSELPENQIYLMTIDEAYDRYQQTELEAQVCLFITSELASEASPDWERLVPEELKTLDLIDALHMGLFAEGPITDLAKAVKKRLDQFDPAAKR
jgi:thioesterase domain-containing protein